MADQKLDALTATTTIDDTDLLYVEKDPSGTPLDRKITGANLKASLGGGIAWTQRINESGASATNFSSATGSHASSGGVLQTVAGGSGAVAYVNNVTLNSPLIVVEAEIRFDAFGAANAQAGVGLGTANETQPSVVDLVTTSGSGSGAQHRLSRFFVGGGVAVSISDIATATWYKLRAVFAGPAGTIYKDGTANGTGVVAPSGFDHLQLSAYQASVSYRNIKAWTGDLTLPA